MEINKTLLMGKTNFEMRGNLAQKEPKMLEEWEREDLYHQVMEQNKNMPCFMLHDGPPYANGDMHCGHMLNRILKDVIVRFKSMDGYYTPFFPGWDTHGLPIENAVTKKGVNRKTTPPYDFRKKCDEFAHTQVERQKGQVRRLGILADFDKRYLTLDKEFEKSQIEVFAKMALDGLIFKGLKPVYYSPSSESALAEAEIEYYDVTAKTIYVKFPVIDGKGLLNKGDYFIIWTTTPWTIPANLAIALNPDMEYGLFKTEKGNLVFLVELKQKMMDVLNLSTCELIKTFKGRETEYITTKHPLYDRETLVIQGAYVSADAGSGCVHIAPGHGEDDFNVCKKYKLPPYCPVDEHGCMDNTVGERLSGLFYEEANEEVLKMLDEEGVLLNVTEITHSYPHDWRTKKPVIFRATPQWFCSIDKIRDKLLKQIDEVNWTPSWGKLRMHNMIKDREDWCISRQRAWGVPLPIIYDKDNNALMEKEIFDHIADLVGEYGSGIWTKLSAEELLPESYLSAHKDLAPFRKEKDIMDVWFDSGSSFNGVLRTRELKFPADLYLEGSDQYRGWFNSSLIISTAITGKAPYKNVLSHGFVLDGNGNKMSKSLGNGIDPNKIINVYGADVLRLWAATVDYQADVRISEQIVKQVADTYRKIRNTFKFLLANLSDGEEKYFDPKTDMVKTYSRLSTYILAELEKTKNECLDSYNTYSFAYALQEVLNFLVQDVSALYASIAKDSLYCDSASSQRRKEFQSVIYQVVTTLNKLLAPVLCFTMEEVYQNIPGHNKKHVILDEMAKKSCDYDANLLKEYDLFKDYRNLVLKKLEQTRGEQLIGSSLEAVVELHANDSQMELLKNFTADELKDIFIVSEVKISNGDGEVIVSRHSGKKCERCWSYHYQLEEVEGSCVCPRCKKVLSDGKFF